MFKMGTSAATSTMGPDRLATLQTPKVGVIKPATPCVVTHYDCLGNINHTFADGTYC